MIKKTLFLSLFCLGIFRLGFPQSRTSFDPVSKYKAIFIYGFTNYFIWPEELKKGDFRIGVYGASDQLIAELKKLASLKQVGNQKIDIINLDLYSDVKKIPALHMLYVDVALRNNFKIKDVSKGTLVITDNEKDFKNYAIGFRYVQDKLKFGYNADNVVRFGIEGKEGFEKLAIENYSNKDKYIEDRTTDEKRIIEQNANIGSGANPKVSIAPTTTNSQSSEQPPQYNPADKTKAIFIYGFTKYCEWSEASVNGNFKIGLIGASKNLKWELKKLASVKKVNEQTIEIIEIDEKTDLQKMPQTQILYCDWSNLKNIDLKKLPKNTLIITDSPQDYSKAVITFLYHESRLKFAYNEFLGRHLGLKIKDEFKALATINYEPSSKERLELLNEKAIKSNEEAPVKPKEVNPININNAAIDKNSKAAIASKTILSKAKIDAAKSEWESVLEKIKGNLDEVTLSKEEVQQISGKLIDQEKDLEAQQLQIDFQITNIEIQKELMTQQEKNIKEKEKKLLNQESELIIQSDKINRQQTIIWLSLAAVLSVVFGLYMLFQNYSKSKKANMLLEKQKSEIQSQKLLIEEKQHEILDSINYAKRIQTALLASKQLLDENLKDYFIFYKPKDIVSGDFYWAYKSVTSSAVEKSIEGVSDKFILVTADSTGHGVPGSIMSMLNISCLEKAVEVERLTEPSDILNHTRIKIIESLKKDGSQDGGKDGMDCSLVSFDFNGNTMSYSAANNPVWLVRSNGQKELLELDPDKMPVGKHDRDTKPFTQHKIDLIKGDVIYVFTDGLPDQFGGPRGKKFMYKRMKEMLLSISHLPMHEQQSKIDLELSNWKGDNEQVDDITLIGIRI